MTDKMRQEFEVWANDYIGIDCEAMPYGKFDDDMEPQYHNKSDPDGALIVSSMFAAWKASRSALCVELPSRISDDSDKWSAGYDFGVDAAADSLDSVGVHYKWQA